MNIFDLHVHTWGNPHGPEPFLAKLAQAGVYGAAVFSDRPGTFYTGGAPFKERVGSILAFCRDHPGRLFPVLWIHPHEDRAVEKAKEAGMNAHLAKPLEIERIAETIHKYIK